MIATQFGLVLFDLFVIFDSHNISFHVMTMSLFGIMNFSYKLYSTISFNSNFIVFNTVRHRGPKTQVGPGLRPNGTAPSL